MLLGLRRIVGRLTEEAWCAAAVREAEKLARLHRVAALQYDAVGIRAHLDARHHFELAAHYKAKAEHLSVPPNFRKDDQ